jgi:choline dehydrogenase
VNFRYFEEGRDTDGRDLAAMSAGIQFVRRVMRSPLLFGHVADEVLPGPGCATGDELRKYVGSQTWGHHASCTNKMGPASDPTAVVDSRFRVHGVSGLRVVDASVFPKIPGFFIVAPTYMLSEKASDVILEDARGA